MGVRSAALGRGLAQVESSVGTLIAFATQPGNVALDGEGRNSPFTAALLKTMERPGLPLSEIMIVVRNAVLQQTANRQVPWEHSSLTGQFYFIPPIPAAAPSAAVQTREPDQATLEITFWNSIKDEKNSRLFEAYLKRYPNGAFADIARISLEQQKTASLKSAVDQPNDRIALTDSGLITEIRERLYELNFDPGVTTGPLGEPTRQAIREFEQRSSLAPTGEATQGLLRRLREIGGLKPWGAIVYAKSSKQWGMAWAQGTRKAAVETARSSCGDAAKCSVETSFFGTDCGVFAHSGSSWAIVAHDDIKKAKDAALSDCGKHGKSCRIIASVCADGAERFRAAN
jgi:hypothetical protein